MDQNWGKYIMVIGIVIVVIGLMVYLLWDKLQWVGHLPGDIRIERENFRAYFPITTLIVLSLLFTLIVNIMKRFL